MEGSKEEIKEKKRNRKRRKKERRRKKRKEEEESFVCYQSISADGGCASIASTHTLTFTSYSLSLIEYNRLSHGCYLQTYTYGYLSPHTTPPHLTSLFHFTTAQSGTDDYSTDAYGGALYADIPVSAALHSHHKLLFLKLVCRYLYLNDWHTTHDEDGSPSILHTTTKPIMPVTLTRLTNSPLLLGETFTTILQSLL